MHTELQCQLKNVRHPVTFDKEPQLHLRNKSPAILSLLKELCFSLWEEINTFIK